MENKPKILLCSDDINTHTGVATMARAIVDNTLEDFEWVNMGGMVRHPYHGQYQILENGVKVYGANKYGDREMFREILKVEKPDGILFFTDPRHFTEHFTMEYEVRKSIPIMYYNIWDNTPAPQYNYPFYESCDGLFCISQNTFEVVQKVLGDECKNKVVEYVPHGINEEMFHYVSREEVPNKLIKKTFGDMSVKDYDFIILWINKNMSRKRPMDLMLAFDHMADFVDGSVCLLMHTNPIHPSGTDLYQFKYDNITHQEDIYFSSNGKLDREEMKYLYGLADVVVNHSDNEGWGLQVTEAMMCEKPVIANSIGGMKDQIFDSRKRGMEGDWAFVLHPASSNLIGNLTTPYIYESRVNVGQITNRLIDAYNHTDESLRAKGKKGREYAIESGFTEQRMVDSLRKAIHATLKNFKPRKRLRVRKI